MLHRKSVPALSMMALVSTAAFVAAADRAALPLSKARPKHGLRRRTRAKHGRPPRAAAGKCSPSSILRIPWHKGTCRR